MKNIFKLAISTIALGTMLVSCSADDTETAKETITIEALNKDKEMAEITVPYNPERIAMLDLAALDIIDNLGLGQRVVGCASTSIDYLQDYSDVKNIGNIKTPDLEATLECEPDIIFIGGRLTSYYEQLEEIAPVVLLTTDSNIGLVESTLNNAKTIASIFGMDDKIEDLVNQYSSRITTLNEKYSGTTASVGMVTSGSYNTLNSTGRCSIIGNEIGFNNLADSSNTEISSAHGEETSFEYLLRTNPDYIFVLDRDTAIGTEGAKLAQEVMDNEIIHETNAYKNGHVVILNNPAVWYTAEGGITALGIMLSDLEAALL